MMTRFLTIYTVAEGDVLVKKIEVIEDENIMSVRRQLAEKHGPSVRIIKIRRMEEWDYEKS